MQEKTDKEGVKFPRRHKNYSSNWCILFPGGFPAVFVRYLLRQNNIGECLHSVSGHTRNVLPSRTIRLLPDLGYLCQSQKWNRCRNVFNGLRSTFCTARRIFLFVCFFFVLLSFWAEKKKLLHSKKFGRHRSGWDHQFIGQMEKGEEGVGNKKGNEFRWEVKSRCGWVWNSQCIALAARSVDRLNIWC